MRWEAPGAELMPTGMQAFGFSKLRQPRKLLRQDWPDITGTIRTVQRYVIKPIDVLYRSGED
jgi:hypothetical protein